MLDVKKCCHEDPSRLKFPFLWLRTPRIHYMEVYYFHHRNPKIQYGPTENVWTRDQLHITVGVRLIARVKISFPKVYSPKLLFHHPCCQTSNTFSCPSVSYRVRYFLVIHESLEWGSVSLLSSSRDLNRLSSNRQLRGRNAPIQ